MQVTFTIPDEHIARISAAFRVETIEQFKNEIIRIVKDTVQQHEEEEHRREILSVTLSDDLIQ